jgi:hypothetical protein
MWARAFRLEDRVDQVHAFLPMGSVVSQLPEKPREGKEKESLAALVILSEAKNLAFFADMRGEILHSAALRSE